MTFPSLYQSTRGEGTPFMRHSSTTSWPSDAWRSCRLWWDKTGCISKHMIDSSSMHPYVKDSTFVNTGAAMIGCPFNPCR